MILKHKCICSYFGRLPERVNMFACDSGQTWDSMEENERRAKKKLSEVGALGCRFCKKISEPMRVATGNLRWNSGDIFLPYKLCGGGGCSMEWRQRRGGSPHLRRGQGSRSVGRPAWHPPCRTQALNADGDTPATNQGAKSPEDARSWLLSSGPTSWDLAL